MFMLSSACVVCHRDHFAPHDIGCLYGPHRPSSFGPDGASADTFRWWLPVEETEGIDRDPLSAVMEGMRWRRFNGVAPADITHLSLPLQTQGWVLAGYARSADSSDLPFSVFAVRHANRCCQREKTFWIAGTATGRAGVFALDLTSSPLAA